MINLAYFADGHVEKIISHHTLCDRYISFKTESGKYVCTIVDGVYVFFKAMPIKFIPTMEIVKIEFNDISQERTNN